MLADDETNITEIELLPDGRICVFGTSLEVLEVLDQLQGGGDSNVRQRMDTCETNSPVTQSCVEHVRNQPHA